MKSVGIGIVGVCAAMAVTVTDAAAHPHVFVEAKTELVFDDSGRLSAIQHAWRFDGPFSAFAVQGLDTDQNGILTQAELSELAQVNVDSLSEYDNFTFLYQGDTDFSFQKAQDYWLDYSGGRLTLYFALPLAEPLEVGATPVVLDVYDPEYFVAFEMVKTGPFGLVDAPPACKLKVDVGGELDPMTATQLALIPSDQREIPQEYRAMTGVLANEAILTCADG
ncbi:DUF1007 family protein [Amorphus sp. 3PC139-8]|uniref:DUF1007 family protein n=1 Tax=Amorphus sp. 3PC139-8 TaxID=2735676 RepID=UPI00345CDAF4